MEGRRGAETQRRGRKNGRSHDRIRVAERAPRKRFSAPLRLCGDPFAGMTGRGSLLGLFLLLQLGAEKVAEGAEALAGGRGLAAVGLVLGAPLGALGGGPGQAVPAALVDVDDLRLELGAHRRGLVIVRSARRTQLRVR